MRNVKREPTYLPTNRSLCCFLAFLLLNLLVVACGEKGNHFRLEGKFQNINQGEFYLCNLQQGHRDTIVLRDGKFTYERDLQDTMQLVLMFPNYSELPIFASPGSRVKIEGDVSHLKETVVKGTKDNEDMTVFRLQTQDMMPPEVKAKALQFIEAHPESPVSQYLLYRYFILAVDADYQEIARLGSLLLEASPANVGRVQLQKRLESVAQLKYSGKLPAFSAVDTEGRRVDNSLLKGKVGAIMVWSSWHYMSQNLLRQMHRLQKQHHDSISVVSICLDASPDEGRHTLTSDSIVWPNVCDGLMWQSPIVSQLGIAYVADNIIVDKDGNIAGRMLKAKEMEDKIDALLKKK